MSKHSRRRRRLNVEGLDSRTLLAGDVALVVDYSSDGCGHASDSPEEPSAEVAQSASLAQRPQASATPVTIEARDAVMMIVEDWFARFDVLADGRLEASEIEDSEASSEPNNVPRLEDTNEASIPVEDDLAIDDSVAAIEETHLNEATEESPATEEVLPVPVAEVQEASSEAIEQPTAPIALAEKHMPTAENSSGATEVDASAAETIDSTPADVSLAEEVLRLVNQHRAEANLEPVVLNDNLSAAAADHSRDMNELNFFDHVSPVAGKEQFFQRAANFGTSARSENIALGHPTAAAVVDGWINSPGHRANILDPLVTRMGLGVEGIYWTQMFGI